MKRFEEFLDGLEFLCSPQDDAQIEELLGCELSEYTEISTATGVWNYQGAHFMQYLSRDGEVYYEVAIYNTIATFHNLQYAAEMLWDEYAKEEICKLSNSDKYEDLTQRLRKFVWEPVERANLFAYVLGMEAKNPQHEQHLSYYKAQINTLIEEILETS